MKKILIVMLIIILLGTAGTVFVYQYFIGFEVSSPKVTGISYKKIDDENCIVFNIEQKKKHNGYCIEISPDKEFITDIKVEYIESKAKNIEFKSKGWNFKKGDKFYIKVSSWIDIGEKKEFSSYHIYNHSVK